MTDTEAKEAERLATTVARTKLFQKAYLVAMGAKSLSPYSDAEAAVHAVYRFLREVNVDD